MMYTDDIATALERFHAYREENLQYCRAHPAAQVSSFWEDHFADRQNFPDVQEFLTFRRENFVYGIGDTAPASIERKRAEFTAVRKSIQLFTPFEFIESLREPTLGSPLVFPIGKTCLSASFILNAGTAFRIKHLYDRLGPPRRPNIAEVGAGWGACATQLHQLCQPASYTVVDLPENLCLSSTYLSLGLRSCRTEFVSCAPGNTLAPRPGSLHFGMPPAIANLGGPYDLIINTFSFQEMDLETVRSYLRWAHRSLAPDGLLISFNSHDKAGVTRPSQYLEEGLSLVHMAPFRKVPSGWFNTIPYEMVFRPSGTTTSREMAAKIDVLGELIQLGLDGNLEASVRKALSGTGHDDELRSLSRFLYGVDHIDRHDALADALNVQGVLGHFVAGNYRYSQGDISAAHMHLEASLAAGLTDFAELRARAMLHVAGYEQDVAAMLGSAAGLAEELDDLLRARPVAEFQKHISRILHVDESRAPSRFVGLGNTVRRALRGLSPTEGG